MIQVVKLSDEEQIKLYMKCSKKELAKMLLECNKNIIMYSNLVFDESYYPIKRSNTSFGEQYMPEGSTCSSQYKIQ